MNRREFLKGLGTVAVSVVIPSRGQKEVVSGEAEHSDVFNLPNQEALDAIKALFNDMSVSAGKAVANLNVLIDELRILCDSLE